MALNIKNPRTEKLAQELARLTGETLTEAVTVALADRLAALRRPPEQGALAHEIAGIQQFVRERLRNDSRTAEEMLGYDEYGLPR